MISLSRECKVSIQYIVYMMTYKNLPQATNTALHEITQETAPDLKQLFTSVLKYHGR